MLNSETIFGFDSPADNEPLFEFYIHRAKIMTVPSECEFIFLYDNSRKTIKMEKKDFQEWKEKIDSTLKITGREVYTNSFITDEYKNPSIS